MAEDKKRFVRVVLPHLQGLLKNLRTAAQSLDKPGAVALQGMLDAVRSDLSLAIETHDAELSGEIPQIEAPKAEEALLKEEVKPESKEEKRPSPKPEPQRTPPAKKPSRK